MTRSPILIDTNIVSYLFRGAAQSNLYRPHLEGVLVSISFITVGELYYGAEKRGWGKDRRNRLEAALRNFVVVHYDRAIAKRYGLVVAERERLGRPISCADAWIAACALRHDMPLVTHNPKDFEQIGGLALITECGD